MSNNETDPNAYLWREGERLNALQQAKGKVYSEITFKFWADPDVYAQEYGEELPAATVLEKAHDDFVEVLTHQDDRVLPWRGAKIVPVQPLLVNDRTARELKEKYNAWRAEGSVLSARENMPDERVDADDWHAHDDAAKELYGELASYLFALDECGHQTVTVSRGDDGKDHVQCDDCPTGWFVSGS